MSRQLRTLLWAVPLLVVIAIALLAPHTQPGWFPRLALALMGAGGAFSLVWAIAGYITRRLSPVAAAGSLLIGVGLILYGSQWLPGAPANASRSLAGLALCILGTMIQISTMNPAGK
ncbi:MAG TPA: hypothetical protein VFW89_04895 [Gemmatimonadaceae bacterium]|nr:hypothetical protein [Gemmatimonadaceae bacterium]